MTCPYCNNFDQVIEVIELTPFQPVTDNTSPILCQCGTCRMIFIK